jgi:hypothetical protein
LPRLAAAAALAAALLLAAGAAPRAGAATDLDGYRAALRGALAEVERDPASGPARASERLRALGRVALPDGGAIAPDNSAILAALDARPPDAAAAQAGLRATLAELDRSRAAPPLGAGADASLRGVLARREFLPDEPGPVERLRSWLATRLDEALRGVLGDVAPRLPAGPDFGDVRAWVLGAVVLATLAVVFYVALSLRGTVGRSGPRLADPPPARAAAVELFAQSAVLAARGEFREAARLQYLATLLHGEELGQLRFDRAMTNRELLERARERGGAEAAARLRPLIEHFDRFWYGGAPGTSADYETLVRLSTGAWAATA